MLILLKHLLHNGCAGETLRRHPILVFCDGRTATWEPISHTVCGDEVSHSRFYRQMTLKFREIHRNCESPDPLVDIGWQSLPSCIMNSCMPYLNVSAPLPHFAVTHIYFTLSVTHSSMNVGCIALQSMKKSNYSTYFIFDGRIYRFSRTLMSQCALRTDKFTLVTPRNTYAQSVSWF